MISLDNTIEIDAALAQSFKRNGHAVVRGLASGAEVGEYLPAIKSATQLLRGDFNRVVKRDHALHNQMLLTRQNPPPNN